MLVDDINDHTPHVTSVRGLGEELTMDHRHQPGADIITGQVDAAGGCIGAWWGVARQHKMRIYNVSRQLLPSVGLLGNTR